MEEQKISNGSRVSAGHKGKLKQERGSNLLGRDDKCFLVPSLPLLLRHTEESKSHQGHVSGSDKSHF